MNNTDNFEHWLLYAEADLKMAKLLSVNKKDKFIRRGICFHCQQSVEKCLKGTMLFLNIPYPYSHDILQLVSVIEAAGFHINDKIKSSGYLTEYATGKKYPGDAMEISVQEVGEAIASAKQVLKWSKKVTLDKNLLFK